MHISALCVDILPVVVCVYCCVVYFRSQILYTLHKIGADRCDPGQAGCNDGCKHDGKYKGKKLTSVKSFEAVEEREYKNNASTPQHNSYFTLCLICEPQPLSPFSITSFLHLISLTYCLFDLFSLFIFSTSSKVLHSPHLNYPTPYPILLFPIPSLNIFHISNNSSTVTHTRRRII